MVPDELLEATTLCGPEGYVQRATRRLPRGRRDHLNVTPVPTGDQTAESIVENVKTWSN